MNVSKRCLPSMLARCKLCHSHSIRYSYSSRVSRSVTNEPLDYSDLLCDDDDDDIQFSVGHKLRISNLDSSTNAADLKTLCAKYGTITNIHVPTSPQNSAMHRGFGYVWYKSKRHLQKAMANINGMRVRDSVLYTEHCIDGQKNRIKAAVPNKQKRHLSPRTFTPSSENTASEDRSPKEPIIKRDKSLKIPTVTTVNLGGLPADITIWKIKQMFDGIGRCQEIHVYEYQHLQHTFLNAVVKLDTTTLNNRYTHEMKFDKLRPKMIDSDDEYLKDDNDDVDDKRDETEEIQIENVLNIFRSKRKHRIQSDKMPQSEELDAAHTDVLSVDLDQMMRK